MNKFSNVPKDWKIKKIKYLGNIINGSTPDSDNTDYYDGDIVWITPADMDDFGHISESSRTITKAGYNSCGTTLVPPNSVIISNRAPIGKLAINDVWLCTNQGCKAIVPFKNIDYNYLFYSLFAFNDEIVSLGRGTTFLELGTYDLGQFELAIPNLKEQTLIVEKLEQELIDVNNIINNTKEQISILEKYKRSLALEICSNGLSKHDRKNVDYSWFKSIPSSWDIKRLKYVIDRISSGGTPESSNEELYCDDGVCWVAIGDMSTNDYVCDTEKHLTKMGIRDKNLEVYAPGTLIYSIYATIGKVAELKVPATINQALLAIMPNESIIDKEFLKYYLFAIEDKVKEDVSTNTQSNLNLQKVLNFEIVLPSLEEQKAITSYLSDKFNHINMLLQKKKDALDKITKYKKSIVLEYVTGKKRVEVD